MITVDIELTSGCYLTLTNAFIAGNGIAGNLADGSPFRVDDSDILRVNKRPPNGRQNGA